MLLNGEHNECKPAIRQTSARLTCCASFHLASCNDVGYFAEYWLLCGRSSAMWFVWTHTHISVRICQTTIKRMLNVDRCIEFTILTESVQFVPCENQVRFGCTVRLSGKSKWSTAWPSKKCSSNIFGNWVITSTSLRVWTIGLTTNQQSPKSFSSLKVIAQPSWPDSHSYSAWYVGCFSTVRILNVSCEPILIPTRCSDLVGVWCSNSGRQNCGQSRIFLL